MLPELQSLAALASSEPEISVVRGEPGCPWSFNWESRVITAKPEDLDLRPADYCRGLILHESAHAAITRIDRIVPKQMLPRLHMLLNAIEDCRIETWLQLRFEGCKPWIRLYNNHLFGKSSAITNHRVCTDPAAAFFSGMLDRWWNLNPLLQLHPEAAASLDRIWLHFKRAVAAHPSARADLPASIFHSYASHPVSLCYLAADRQSPPSPVECEIRMCQHRMWSITWQHIVPEFLKLLDHPDSGMTRRQIEQMCIDGTAHRDGTRQCSVHHRRSRPGRGRGVFTAGQSSAYSASRARHGTLIESCSDVLLRFLHAESRPKTTRFHRSGQRLDLRVAMQFEADPRLHDRLWHRSTLPLHPDPAFVVAVDSSASMAGEKATATFDALVILREACLRLGIPLSILAFHSSASILQEIDNPRQAAIESRLAGLLSPSGGTDMTRALTLASRILKKCPNRHRHLWILSDGETSNPQEARRILRAIRVGGTTIHGLGLGDQSSEIATLIPGAATMLSPHLLPSTFAALLRGSIIPFASHCH
jgi:Mg-chelatase subunit ChlD